MHPHLVAGSQLGKVPGRGIAQGRTGGGQLLHHLVGRFSLNFGIIPLQASGDIARLRIAFILSGPVGILANDGSLCGQGGRIPVRFQVRRQIAQKLQKTGSAFRNGSADIAFPLQIQQPGKLHFGVFGLVYRGTGVFDGLHQRLVSLAVLLPVGIAAAVAGGFHNGHIRIPEPSVLLQGKGKPVFWTHAQTAVIARHGGPYLLPGRGGPGKHPFPLAEVFMPVQRLLRLILLQQLRRSGTALHGSQGIGLARQQKNLQFFCGAYRNKAQEQEGQQIGHLSYNCRNTTITAGIFLFNRQLPDMGAGRRRKRKRPVLLLCSRWAA